MSIVYEITNICRGEGGGRGQHFVTVRLNGSFEMICTEMQTETVIEMKRSQKKKKF